MAKYQTNLADTNYGKSQGCVVRHSIREAHKKYLVVNLKRLDYVYINVILNASTSLIKNRKRAMNASMMNAVAISAEEEKAQGLVKGRNYGGCFGVADGNTLVYEGDDVWTAVKKGGESRTEKNPKVSAAVRKYLGWE